MSTAREEWERERRDRARQEAKQRSVPPPKPSERAKLPGGRWRRVQAWVNVATTAVAVVLPSAGIARPQPGETHSRTVATSTTNRTEAARSTHRADHGGKEETPETPELPGKGDGPSREDAIKAPSRKGGVRQVTTDDRNAVAAIPGELWNPRTIGTFNKDGFTVALAADREERGSNVVGNLMATQPPPRLSRSSGQVASIDLSSVQPAISVQAVQLQPAQVREMSAGVKGILKNNEAAVWSAYTDYRGEMTRLLKGNPAVARDVDAIFAKSQPELLKVFDPAKKAATDWRHEHSRQGKSADFAGLTQGFGKSTQAADGLFSAMHAEITDRVGGMLGSREKAERFLGPAPKVSDRLNLDAGLSKLTKDVLSGAQLTKGMGAATQAIG